jgi:dTDP-4-dehydrorhamnose reductase/selenocysteine lyase/cysteine desulfurase
MDFDSQYNVPGDVLYFNSAGHCILPLSSQELGIEQIRAQGAPWQGYGNEAEDNALIRSRFAEIINAYSVDCITTCHSTSLAISTAAYNAVLLQKLDASSKVVVLGQEMGSGVLPWQIACKTTGATLVIVGEGIENSEDFRVMDDFEWTEAILAALDASVRIVCLPNVHWCDGTLIDLHRIAARIQEYPVDTRPWLIIDGTQSIGVMPFNAQAIQPTFVACSIHKWLNGPFGMSMIYLDPAFHSVWSPLEHHDRNRIGCELLAWDCLGGMQPGTGYPTELYHDARAVGSGGHPNPITVSMLRNSLGLVLKWGISNIYTHCADMNQHLTTAIASSEVAHLFHWKPAHKRCNHIVGVYFNIPAWKAYLRVPAVNKLELGTFLCKHMKSKGAHVVMRGGCLRMSVYLFNNAEQCKALAHALLGACTAYASTFPSLVSSPGVEIAPAGNDSSYNILITGAAGWLGQFVWKELLKHPSTPQGQAIQLWGGYHTSVPEWIPESQRVLMDFDNDESVVTANNRVRPQVVIHLAAVSSVLGCEQNPTRAYTVNCNKPLVDAVRKLDNNCQLIFSSTDLVYDGNLAPYAASDTEVPVPVNVYGASKLAMERLLLAELPQRSHVLRLSNMVGPAFAYKNAGTKFLQFLQNAYNAKQRLGLKDDEKRSFVYVQDVVNVIIALSLPIESATSGSSAATRVLNVGGPEGLSRLELAALLCKANGGTLCVEGEGGAGTDVDASALANDKDWVVQRMSGPAGNGPASPKDVTMLSGPTFAALGITSTSMMEAIPLSLQA